MLLFQRNIHPLCTVYNEEFEDTNGVIRSTKHYTENY